MSFGSGFGVPFGGSGVTAISSPVSEIAAEDPITFDFSDEPDGPLPGQWEFFILEDDGAGNLTGLLESNPNAFFRIAGGLGLWDFTRSPATGSPFQEQGVAASPLGIIQGRNAELAIAFVPPPKLLVAAQDEFFLEVTAGLRMSANGTSFVGARARSRWVAGVWVEPVAFEIVHGAQATPAVLAAAVFDYPNPLDPWCAGPLAEVRVILRGSNLKAELSGAQALLEVDPVPIIADARPFVMVRVYNRLGNVFTAPPIVAGVQLQTLRDSERLGSAPCVEGHEQLKAPLHQGATRLPVRALESQGFLRQKGGRVFEVIKSFEVDEAGVRSVFNAGNRLIVTEPVQNQALMPVSVDLAHIRGLKEKAGQA